MSELSTGILFGRTERGRRDDDGMGIGLSALDQMRQKGSRLHRLAEPHLVRKDAVDALSGGGIHRKVGQAQGDWRLRGITSRSTHLVEKQNKPIQADQLEGLETQVAGRWRTGERMKEEWHLGAMP